MCPFVIMSSMYISYSMRICAVCVHDVSLCQYKQDDGGHCQESQQYDDHDTHTSPQRIVLHVNRKETWLPC